MGFAGRLSLGIFVLYLFICENDLIDVFTGFLALALMLAELGLKILWLVLELVSFGFLSVWFSSLVSG